MNVSILTMLAAPYVLFGIIVGLMYRAVRRARREREARMAADEKDPGLPGSAAGDQWPEEGHSCPTPAEPAKR